MHYRAGRSETDARGGRSSTQGAGVRRSFRGVLMPSCTRCWIEARRSHDLRPCRCLLQKVRSGRSDGFVWVQRPTLAVERPFNKREHEWFRQDAGSGMDEALRHAAHKWQSAGLREQEGCKCRVHPRKRHTVTRLEDHGEEQETGGYAEASALSYCVEAFRCTGG